VEGGGREGSPFAMAYRMAMLCVLSIHLEDGSLPSDDLPHHSSKAETTQWSVQYCPGRVLICISLIPILILTGMRLRMGQYTHTYTHTHTHAHTHTSGGSRNLERGVQFRVKNFSPSFFSYQDGLSWHLRVLY